MTKLTSIPERTVAEERLVRIVGKTLADAIRLGFVERPKALEQTVNGHVALALDYARYDLAADAECRVSRVRAAAVERCVAGGIPLELLLSLHRACAIAKEHCGHIGLVYTDCQLALEPLIRAAVDRGESRALRYDKDRRYLGQVLLETTSTAAPPAHAWLCSMCMPDRDVEELTLGPIFAPSACQGCGTPCDTQALRCFPRRVVPAAYYETLGWKWEENATP